MTIVLPEEAMAAVRHLEQSTQRTVAPVVEALTEPAWSHGWLLPVLSVIGGVLLLWLGLVVALWLARPDDVALRDALRLLPDVLRLLKRLAGDPSLPRGVRVRLALLMVYLALPFDLIPDFIPVLGYADDAIIVAAVLRSVTRRASPEAVYRHWPGTPEGLAAVCRLCGIPKPRGLAP